MSDQPNPPNTPVRKRLLLPFILLVLAILIRLPGLTWGLKDGLHNQSLHPDEDLNYRVTRAIEPAHLSFTPGFYNYGTLYLTTMRVAEDVAFGYAGHSDQPDKNWDDIRTGELAGRVVSMLAGSLLAMVGYFLARRFTGELGAFCAGLVLAVAPGLVVHSRFATVDVFATLFVGLSALYSVRILMDEEPAWLKSVILAGVCVGCSAGTKYSGGLAILMPLTALFLRKPPKMPQLMGATILSTLVTFLISTPGALLDRVQFMKDVNDEFKHSRTGHGMVFVGTSNGYIYHLSNLCLGVGVFLVFLGLGALIWAVVRKEKWAWVLLAFSVPYLVTIGGAEVKFMRYVFPLTVGLAAGVGFAIGEGHRLRKGYGALVAVGLLGIGGLDSGGLKGSWFFTNAMLNQDNREQAATYIKSKSNDSTVAGLISDPWFWSPTLFPDSSAGNYLPSLKKAGMAQATNPKVMVLDFSALPNPLPDYVTYSDFETIYAERVSQLSSIPSEYAQDVTHYKQVMDLLKQSYTPDAQFGDDTRIVEDMRYVMPAVYVWKRKA